MGGIFEVVSLEMVLFREGGDSGGFTRANVTEGCKNNVGLKRSGLARTVMRWAMPHIHHIRWTASCRGGPCMGDSPQPDPILSYAWGTRGTSLSGRRASNDTGVELPARDASTPLEAIDILVAFLMSNIYSCPSGAGLGETRYGPNVFRDIWDKVTRWDDIVTQNRTMRAWMNAGAMSDGQVDGRRSTEVHRGFRVEGNRPSEELNMVLTYVVDHMPAIYLLGHATETTRERSITVLNEYDPLARSLFGDKVSETVKLGG